MANKRMFSLDVVDTDQFLEMPVTTQALYFHLGMRADDDGFISSPRKTMKIANCTNDDLRLLISKGYIIPFETGIVVITDWKKNNFIRNDRYKPTQYQKELKTLSVSGGSYVLNAVGIPSDNQTVYQMEPQVRLGKDSIDKYIVEQNSTGYPFKEIIEYLNNRSGKNYRYTTKATQKHIRARFEEGFSLEDFKRVIDWKTSEWLGNDKMERYLRPETLFGTKFESYLNESPTLPKDLPEETEEPEEHIDLWSEE